MNNKLTLIPFFVIEKKSKLSPSYYQVYKICTNPKDEKYVVYLLIVGIYNVGMPEELLQFMNAIAQVIKR
eukprot:6233722-Ditylum_brightwellii.AAC.1